MSASLDEVRVVQDDLLKKLRFHRNVNGAGIVKYPDGWDIKVNLTKEHQWWHRKLPFPYYKGVRIHYQVIGRVVAA